MNKQHASQITAADVYSTDDLRRHNEAMGHYFFSPDTMSFFSSRVAADVYKTACDHLIVFVTSERDKYGNGPRLYKVHGYNLRTARTWTAEQMDGYRTLIEAKKAAREWAPTVTYYGQGDLYHDLQHAREVAAAA